MGTSRWCIIPNFFIPSNITYFRYILHLKIFDIENSNILTDIHFFFRLSQWYMITRIKAPLCSKRHFESFYLQKTKLESRFLTILQILEFWHQKISNFSFWLRLEHMPFNCQHTCQKGSQGFKGLHFGFGDRGHSPFRLEIRTIFGLMVSSGLQEITISTSSAGWVNAFSKFDYAVDCLNISRTTARQHKILMKSGFWLERLWTSTLVVEKQ